MMDLMLIQPVASFQNPYPILPQDAVGIGMLTIIAYIKSKGFQGEVLHLPKAIEKGIPFEQVFEKIEKENPKVVGIGLNWLHFSEGAIQLAQILRKRYPDLTIVVGGQHATLFAKEILEECDALDGITIGESEKTYAYLLEKVTREDRKIPEGIPGIMQYNDAGEIVSIGPEIVNELDELPLYSYKVVWPEVEEICAALDTVRGECIMNCAYCIESKTNSLQGRKRFTQHSPEYLAEQIEFFVKEGIQSITIQDPYTFVGDKKIIRMCEILKQKGVKLTLFNLFVEPRLFSKELFLALKEIAKEVTLDYGMETGAKSTSTLIGRDFHNKDLLENITLASSLGIKVLTWWMTALPNDTMDTLKENMDYIEETIQCGAIPRWITPLILFPHTNMAKNNEAYGIQPIMTSFKDFCKYSTVEMNNYGVYTELLTHETAYQSKREIVETTIALKKGILMKIGENRECLKGFGWSDIELDTLEEEAKGSFF